MCLESASFKSMKPSVWKIVKRELIIRWPFTNFITSIYNRSIWEIHFGFILYLIIWLRDSTNITYITMMKENPCWIYLKIWKSLDENLFIEEYVEAYLIWDSMFLIKLEWNQGTKDFLIITVIWKNGTISQNIFWKIGCIGLIWPTPCPPRQ